LGLVCLFVCLSVSCLATTKLAKWALGNPYVDTRLMKAWQIPDRRMPLIKYFLLFWVISA
jgi:hypothetical protein